MTDHPSRFGTGHFVGRQLGCFRTETCLSVSEVSFTRSPRRTYFPLTVPGLYYAGVAALQRFADAGRRGPWSWALLALYMHRWDDSVYSTDFSSVCTRERDKVADAFRKESVYEHMHVYIQPRAECAVVCAPERETKGDLSRELSVSLSEY